MVARHAPHLFPKPTDGNDKHSYFAFAWGNALFSGLDPFWATTKRGASGWDMTLGETQYRWLTKTLTSSKAAMRFVFIHHLVGELGRHVRGGAKPAAYMEGAAKTPTTAKASNKTAPAGKCRFMSFSSKTA